MQTVVVGTPWFPPRQENSADALTGVLVYTQTFALHLPPASTTGIIVVYT